jgi:hypothetical protein
MLSYNFTKTNNVHATSPTPSNVLSTSCSPNGKQCRVVFRSHKACDDVAVIKTAIAQIMNSLLYLIDWIMMVRDSYDFY